MQVDDVKVYRDYNRDHIRSNDKLFTGMFGINQHTCGNSADSPAPSRVGVWSYGCLVGKVPATHYQKFIPILEGSGQKKFDTVVIDGSKFWAWLQNKGYKLVD